MRGARTITVLGTVVFAGVSLASLRADVTGNSASGRRSTGFDDAIHGRETFFPDERPSRRAAERSRRAEKQSRWAAEDEWQVEFATYDAAPPDERSRDAAPGPPDPRQPYPANEPYQPTPYDQYCPEPSPPYPPGPGRPIYESDRGSQPGPQWSNGPGVGAGDPSWGGSPYCDGFGPAGGPVYGAYRQPDCGAMYEGGVCYESAVCGPGGACGHGGAIVIEDGWGDIFNGWMSGSPCGLVAGVEGTFLVPIDEPTQRVVLTDLVTDRQWSGDPHGSLGGGVRTWVGLQRCGWGFRVRYWHFGNDNVDVDPEVPIWAQPAIHESYHLEANTLDFELTQRFCLHCWQIDTSFGARYADLNRFSQVLGTGQLGNGVDVYGLAWGANELEGTGFTASIGGRRPFDPCSCWSFFWNFRGSVLWTDTTVSAFADAAAFTHDPPGVANARNHANAINEDSDTTFIADAQLGVEYRILLCRCPGQLAFRAGVEFQRWDTGDLGAQSESFAFLTGGPPPFGGEAFAAADAHDGDLDLIGFFLGMEWTY